MLSASLVTRWCAPRVKGLRAALVLAKVARFAVLDGAAYLDAMSRFHRYSFGNVLSIARQRPGATHVSGFHAWRRLGRNVKNGEHGIRILAPIISKRKQKDDREKDSMQPNCPRLAGFRRAYVFDVERLFAFVELQGIELAFSESIAPALGTSYGGRIALLPGQSKAEEFSTLVHELAHELMHKAERRTASHRDLGDGQAFHGLDEAKRHEKTAGVPLQPDWRQDPVIVVAHTCRSMSLLPQLSM